MSATFTAKYRGECTACDGTISPGQEVTFAGFSEVAHVKCPVDPTVLARPTCPSCFLELPVTGICGDC